MFYWRKNLFFTLLSLAIIFAHSHAFAYSDKKPQNLQLQDKISLTEENIQSIVSEVKNMIVGLGQGTPIQQRGVIEHVIGLLPPEEQVQLKQALDRKMQEIPCGMQLRVANEEAIPFEQPDKNISEENLSLLPRDIVLEIESLDLGPAATVQDLRKRDSIVATIAGIKDPDVRYKLLELLNSKEKS